MNFNYQLICQNNLLRDLPERNKDVIVRRFGLQGEEESLESIGRTYNITRERVRQIEEQTLQEISKRIETPLCQNVFQHFIKHLKSSGGLKKEDILTQDLGGADFKNHVLFLLTLGKPFQRFKETEKLYPFWTIDKNSLSLAQKSIDSFVSQLQKKAKPLFLPASISPSYIEISKEILKGPEGLYGLNDWPEINPRGVKDKAYIVLKKEERPLHFTEVATLINDSSLSTSKTAVSQTVHNELIKDSRFVLVGRGLYALREWGYEPGVVREVISQTMKKAKHPLAKEEILQQVLQQRQVKPSTILLNLQNKKYFLKNSQGKYLIRRV